MVDAKTIGLLTTVGTAALIGLVVFIIFLFVRRKFLRVYELRRVLNRYRTYNNYNDVRVGFPSKLPGDSPLSWLPTTIGTREDEVVRRISVDSTMILRFVKSQMYTFAILTFFTCAILWPIYATGKNKNLPSNDPKYVQGLQILSLSNIAIGSAKLWGTLVVEYIITFIVLLFLYQDYSKYAIYRRSYRASENPANYSVVVFDIPDESNNEQSVRDHFDSIVPNQVYQVVMARKAKKGMKAEKLLNKVIKKKERAEYEIATSGKRLQHRPGTCSFLMCWKPKVDALEYFDSERRRLEGVILEEGQTAPNANAAVVVLTNKRAASLVAQTNSSGNSHAWNVERAPEPAAMHWQALHIPAYQVPWRAAAVIAMVLAIIIFWFPIAGFVMGLANLESLSRVGAFSWADGIANASPFVVGLIENALPAIVYAILIALVPTVFRIAVSQRRIPSQHVIEAKTRNYYYIFIIFASFIFIVLGAAALTELQDAIDDPGQLTDLLASSVPRNGLFYTSFVALKTFLPLTLLLLNPGRLIVRAIKLKMAKTERERRIAEETGSIFPFFKMYGLCMMMSLLGITYSTLAPLVTLFVLIFFIIAYAVFKHNLIYSSYRRWDGGGWDYPGAFWGVIVGLIVKQLTMIGVLGLFEAVAPSILTVPLLLSSIIFGLFCHRRFHKVSIHGSLHDLSAESSKEHEIPSLYRDIYRQPGVSLEPYQDLSGIVDPEDVYEEEQSSHDSEGKLRSEYNDSSVGYVPDATAERSQL